MNKIYRLKFDKRRNELVVVSEITTGMSKEKSTGHLAELTALSPFRKLLGTLTPLALLTGLIISLFPGMALANPDLPTGGQIVGGQGSISTSGNQMTIHQQTQNMATNWHSFDIGKNNTVQFVQPDSSSVALNRVTGGSGSQIMGTLKANGQVFILNPNGVLFGKDARVNVAGLVASTKNINTADFMKGQYTLSGSGNPGAQVVNQGSLTTSKGGYIVLAGERVSNSGTVTTPGGKTVLAAGKTVTLQLDNGGLTSVSVNGSVVNALVENRGLISATDGRVYLTAKGQDMLLNTVVNNSGTIEAKGLASRGGEIVLNGGDSGVVSQTGTLLADSHTGQGGKITLEGQNIHLAGNSLTSATGKTGGGEAYVGGGWQGKDSRIKNASKVVMDKTATIDVSATDAGNGGTAVLWSDDYTNFRGVVLAKGGTQSGNGGRVETSSYKNLQAFGDVETSARAGKGGEWLLDPTNVTIVSASDNTNVTENNADNDHMFSPSVSGAKVSAGKISEQLNNGANVTIQTSGVDTEGQQGNITIADNVNITKSSGTGDATLTLLADKNIQVGSASDGNKSTNISISSTSGKLNLKLLAGKTVNDGSAKVLLGKQSTTVSLNSGDFTVASAQDGGKINFLAPHGDGESITAGNISITAMGTEGMNTLGLNLNASGNIDISAGNITSASTWGQNVTWMAGGHLTATSEGGASFWANDKAHGGGKTTLSAVNDVVIKGENGTVNMNGDGLDKKSGVTVTSSAGSVTVSGKVQDGSVGLILNKVAVSTPKGKTTLDGTTYWGQASVLSGLNIAAGGDVDISGVARRLSDGEPGRASALGIKLSDSTIDSTGGNITLTGFAATHVSHQNISTLEVSNSNLTANSSAGKISLNGTTETTTGLKLTGSKLNAASLDVKGVATIQGTGFSLTDSQLLGGLTDWTNVTFSSAGSAVDAINWLDNSIVTASNREVLMQKWHPENMTVLDMSGQTIFDDTSKPTKGWTKDYSSLSQPNVGWIFNNTSVIASNDVLLQGAGFTNSTITVVGGNLTIDNNGPAVMTGTTIKADDGAVKVHAGKGNIDLKSGNISAKNDITLTADNGSIFLSGTDDSAKSQITSTAGNISVNADATKSGRVDGVYLGNVSLSAGKGIHIVGTIGKEIYNQEGVAGIKFHGDVILSSINNVIEGKSVARVIDGRASGVELFDEAHVVFAGDTTINAESESYSGFLFNAGYSSGEQFVEFRDGSAVINAKDKGNSIVSPNYGDFYDTGAMGAVTWKGRSRVYEFKVSNASLNIKAESMGESLWGLNSYSVSDGPNDEVRRSGYKFTGKGDVSITGISDKGDGVNLRVLNNRELEGKFTVNGESKSRAGVIVPEFADIDVINAVISGKSDTGVGIKLNSADNNARNINLEGNTLTGTSTGGSSGVQIKGNNVSITNGALNGTTKSGNGAGISLAGGKNYVLDGVTLTGMSVDGSGVSVSGTLQVNNGTSVHGTASGTGAGIVVDGTLTTKSGDGVSLNGMANTGDGILVRGNTSLTSGAVVNGTSTTGSGVNIAGKVTMDEATAGKLKASSKSGSGLTLSEGADVHVVQNGGSTPVTTAVVLEGKSDTGSAVTVDGNAAISGVILKGTTKNGTGVTLKNGHLELSDNLAGVEAGSSGKGTAFLMENAVMDGKGYRDSGMGDYVLRPEVSGDGTGFHTLGDNELRSVVVEALSRGKGSAL
ncbi:filamentous hemagglutinin N-terminal domain-containing protein, partial [Salmonella enterica]|nr:filamentous hemagglutinin N-terminal domain-containing protein [Salmonella enterica]